MASSGSPAASEIPGYTLLRPLGRGGMGEVHLALQHSLGREVALKLLAPELARDPQAADRFVREARIAANLHHPHIVPIYEVGTYGGGAFIAMEYEPGGTISALARQGADPALALRIVREVADALEYAHERGVVHRDVKPDNILRRENGLCLLSDFGIAHALDVQTILTREGASAGTPQYMSPEQLRAQPVDGRSDLYSLGVVLHQLLTGRLPYEANNAWAIGMRHVNDPIPRLPAHCAHLQPLLDSLMAKAPDERPRRGADVVARIDALLAGTEPAVTTPLERAPSPSSPRRAPWLAAAALAALALAAAAIWQPWRAPPAPPTATPGAGTASVAPSGTTPSAAIPDRKSVAVLPFENLSGRAEDAYLADGLQEEVLNALARLRDIKVISRTSVMEYRGKTLNVREIGERLGAGTVLEGSIRREGDTLRLTVQLIDARDDSHLLATNYDRDMTHVLELQSAVARQVAEALRATLGRAERGELDHVPTNSGDAYDRYLRAVALFRQPTAGDDLGIVEPIRLLEEALRFDPDCADALALLAQARAWAFFERHQAADGTASRQAYERALALDPDLPEAVLARGMYAMYVGDNLEQALDDFTAVARRRPSSVTAHELLSFALRRKARFAEALEQQELALELDPLSARNYEHVLTTLQGLRRFPEALELTRLAERRFSADAEVYAVRAHIEGYLTGDFVTPLRSALSEHGTRFDAELRKAVEAELAAAEGRYLDAVKLWDEVPSQAPLDRAIRIGCLYAAAGDPDHAEQQFRTAKRLADERLGRDTGALMLKAVAESMLGEHEAALASADAAWAQQPEARDATNGPRFSFNRSVILVRAGRTAEGYAEAARLLRVPFGSPVDFFYGADPLEVVLRGDPRYDQLLHHPPRL